MRATTMMLFLAACARAAEMDYSAMLNKLWSTSGAHARTPATPTQDPSHLP